MGRKCSVAQCRTGYAKVKPGDQQEKVSVYGFPCNQEERKEWLRRIPNKLDTVTQNMGVCALHWPSDTPLVHKRPVVPPSVFSLVSYSHPVSRVRKPPRCRKIQTSSSIVEAVVFSKPETFDEQDRLKPETFVNDFKEKFSKAGLVASNEETVVIFSHERNGSVHTFSLYVTLHERTKSSTFYVCYEAYHGLTQILLPSVTNPLNYWSELEELLSFLQNYSSEQDLQLENKDQVGDRCNSSESLPISMPEISSLPSEKNVASKSVGKEERTTHSEILPLLGLKGLQCATVLKIVTGTKRN